MKVIGLCLAAVLAASSFVASAETFERVELDKDRTSVQYAGPDRKSTRLNSSH